MISSYGSIFSFLTRIVRPSNSGFWNSAGMSPRSSEIMWFGTMSFVRLNQKEESLLSTMPLPGTGDGRMTSNAECGPS